MFSGTDEIEGIQYIIRVNYCGKNIAFIGYITEYLGYYIMSEVLSSVGCTSTYDPSVKSISVGIAISRLVTEDSTLRSISAKLIYLGSGSLV